MIFLKPKCRILYLFLLNVILLGFGSLHSLFKSTLNPDSLTQNIAVLPSLVSLDKSGGSHPYLLHAVLPSPLHSGAVSCPPCRVGTPTRASDRPAAPGYLPRPTSSSEQGRVEDGTLANRAWLSALQALARDVLGTWVLLFLRRRLQWQGSGGGGAEGAEGTLGREVSEEQRQGLGCQGGGQGPLCRDSRCLRAWQEGDNCLDSKERAWVSRRGRS